MFIELNINLVIWLKKIKKLIKAVLKEIEMKIIQLTQLGEPIITNKASENTSPGDYISELDDRMMQMILESTAQEAALMNSQTSEEDQRLMEMAIQESLRENPNPDVMNYEQLQELGDRVGKVSQGYSPDKIQKLRSKANFDYIGEVCPICLEKIEIASLFKKLKCSHIFHADCIDKCLENSKKCPCCSEEVNL